MQVTESLRSETIRCPYCGFHLLSEDALELHLKLDHKK